MSISAKNSERVLLLNLPGMEWGLAHPLLDADKMPHLQALLHAGMSGKLTSPAPMSGPATAFTLATGCYADSHGILDWFARAGASERPDALRFASSTDLQQPPLWEICAMHGVPALAVGWPASFPAQPATTAHPDLTIVADAFATPVGEDFDSWPVATAALSDSGLAADLAELRLHPGEVLPEDVIPFAPLAAQIDQETDDRLAILARAIAQTATLHGAATWLLEHKPWQFCAVQLDFLARLSDEFLRYQAPRLGSVTEQDHRLFGEVVNSAYQFLDLLIGRYQALVGAECHIVLTSDHGYRLGKARPSGGLSALQHRASSRRRLGLLVVSGPAIKQDQLVFGASSVDMAPTISRLLGLPVSAAMDGRVLTHLFDESASHLSEQTKQTYVRPPQPVVELDENSTAVTTIQLQDWLHRGLVPAPPADADLRRDWLDVRHHQAKASALQVRGEFSAAMAELTTALEFDPDNTVTRAELAQCQLNCGEIAQARASLEDLEQSAESGNLVQLLWTRLHTIEGNPDAVNEHLAILSERPHTSALIRQQVGQAHLVAKRWEQARENFVSAIDADVDSPSAHSGLAVALYKLGELDRAIEHFMMSLGLQYRQPRMHYNLGVALAATGRLAQAHQALTNALELRPNLAGANELLKKIQTVRSRQVGQAAVISSQNALGADVTPEPDLD